MWKRWGKLALTYTIVVVAVGVVLVSVVSMLWVFVCAWWAMLVLWILSALCDSAVNRFGKKQREWEDSIRAAARTVQRSEIRRRPTRYWVWTIGILFFLLFTMLQAEELAVITNSFGPFWPTLIVFAWSCGILFVQGIAWRDFGATYFLSDSPFSPGGKIAATIHFQRESPMKYDLIYRVECVRVIAGDEGDIRTTLWFSERKISQNKFGFGSTGRRYIPVDFGLPSSALVSSDAKDERIVWELSIKHVEPWPRRSEGRWRVPYKDRFTIRVERGQQSPAPEAPTGVVS
jgi:hypothetical protein